VAHQLAPGGDLFRHPGALDGVGVFDGDCRLLQRELAHLLAGAFGLVEAFGGVLDESVV
jgi:hypothetical protein